MTDPEPSIDELIDRAGRGDAKARSELLARHAARLRQMVALRIDRRLSARLDPSDVVQEALLEADRRLADYARERPLPFYPWLRQLAWDRMIDLHRRHVQADRRSVNREEGAVPGLPDESRWELAARLAGPSSPSMKARREEAQARVRAALERLSDADREVLVLRHLEQLSVKEVAAVLGIREGTVSVRLLRALQRLRALLGDDLEVQP